MQTREYIEVIVNSQKTLDELNAMYKEGWKIEWEKEYSLQSDLGSGENGHNVRRIPCSRIIEITEPVVFIGVAYPTFVNADTNEPIEVEIEDTDYIHIISKKEGEAEKIIETGKLIGAVTYVLERDFEEKLSKMQIYHIKIGKSAEALKELIQRVVDKRRKEINL